MKLLIFLSLASASAFSSSSSELFADIGHSHDAGAVMSKLQGMMGEAQQKLQIAQRHHKKVVKKIRNEAAAFLDQESSAYGEYLNEYSAELEQASSQLQHAVSLAKDGLSKAEAAQSKTNDWRDPLLEQRAKLNALISASERTIAKADRHRSRQVREGEEHAEETLESEAQKLGMKLGDMTPLVEKSKKSLEAVAEKAAPVKAVKAGTDLASKKDDLKQLQDNIAKATKDQQAKTADANKKLQGFLSKADKDVAEKAKKIQGDLEAAQKAEIEKVIGHKDVPAPKTAAAKTAPKVKGAIAAKIAPKVKGTIAAKTPATKAAPAKVKAIKK